MSIVTSGQGIIINRTSSWIGEHEIVVSEITTSMVPVKELDAYDANPGDVLMVNELGQAEWKKPFDDDRDLRQEYPALEEAWGTLMEALEEYQMVKKLVQDHD